MHSSTLKHVIKPLDGNMFVYSRLSNIEFGKKSTAGIGIKFGLTGTEKYFVDDKEFLVHADEYVFVNHNQEFAAQVDTTETKGLCIQVSNAILNEVRQCLSGKQNELNTYNEPQLSDPIYFINDIHKAAYSNTGAFLAVLKHFNYELDAPVLPEDFFYRLAWHLITEHSNIHHQLSRLPAKKKVTKEELYRRVKKAKEIMNDCYLQPVNMNDIAREINLSKFYFLQTYKKIFGVSPYQYLIFKRLEHAKHLLQFSAYTINEIALLSGYSDIYTFSKSFKKAFNTSPSAFR